MTALTFITVTVTGDYTTLWGTTYSLTVTVDGAPFAGKYLHSGVKHCIDITREE